AHRLVLSNRTLQPDVIGGGKFAWVFYKQEQFLVTAGFKPRHTNGGDRHYQFLFFSIGRAGSYWRVVLSCNADNTKSSIFIMCWGVVADTSHVRQKHRYALPWRY